jgi:hypothetical protein
VNGEREIERKRDCVPYLRLYLIPPPLQLLLHPLGHLLLNAPAQRGIQIVSREPHGKEIVSREPQGKRIAISILCPF